IGYDDGSGMNKMEAKRNVVVINVKGEKLNTEHLIWDAVTKKIYTKEFVKITTKDEVLLGEGLTADQDFSKYTILHPTGTIAINDSDSTNN
ncbi:MAG TPA: LPS export ABC transporter periplasmic protein LptC, partial [Bacteroidia bacterium]|nr:LPS export ABC transporter periplasmic protein LptC [Bacteroidia bacterium]